MMIDKIMKWWVPLRFTHPTTFLVLLMLFIPASSAFASSEAREDFMRGAVYLNQEDYREAIIYLEESLRLDPENKEAARMLSICYFNLGVKDYQNKDMDKAAANFENAIRFDPSNLRAYNNLGIILIEKKQFNQAQEIIEEGLRVKPEDRDLLLLLAQAYQLEKKIPEFLNTLEQAYQYHPDNVELGLNLCWAYRYQNKGQEALKLYKKLKTSHPGEIRIYRDMADLYEAWRDYEQARGVYREWLGRAPADIEMYEAIAQTYLKEEKYARAREEYQRLLKIKPDYPETYLKIAATYEKEGKPEEALTEYRKALKVEPKNPELYKEIGRLYEELDRLKEARLTYQEMAGLDSQAPYPYIRQGLLDEEEARMEEAISNYLKAVELRSENPLPYYRLALAQEKKGDRLKAIAYDKKAVRVGLKAIGKVEGQLFAALEQSGGKLDLSNMEELSKIGKGLEGPQEITRASLETLFLLRKGAELESDLRSLLDDYPKARLLLEYLGIFLEKEKRWDEAIRAWEELLKRDVKVKRGHLGLARAYEQKGLIDQAILAYKRVMTIEDDEEAYKALIRFYTRRNQLPVLIEEWQRKTKVDTRNLTLLSHLRDLLKREGRIKEAEIISNRIEEIRTEK